MCSNSSICSRLFTPPATTTRQETASLSDFARAISVPCIQPSFSTHVKSNSEAYFSASLAPSIRDTSIVSVQPRTAIFPFIASTEIIILCFPIAFSSASKKSVSKTDSPSIGFFFQAAEPIITFSAPKETNSLAFFISLMPPPTRTLPLRKIDFSNCVFAVFPLLSVFRKAASRSITATSPYLLKSAIKSLASSLCKTRSLPFFNCTT